MDIGVQHSLGTATIHDLERLRDNRYVKCLRVGEDPDADVELEYLERLVRDMSIGVNPVVFNMENLAARSRNTFICPPRPDSPLFQGICGAPSTSDTNVECQEGWAMCDLGHYPFTRGIEGRYIRRNSLFARLPDQGIPLPPLPRYPEWYLPCAPQSPSPTSSNGIPTTGGEG